MLQFVDELEPIAQDWQSWAAERPAAPIWLAELHLSDESSRFGGVFVTEPRTVMGLRGWDDAREGIRAEIPWVLFDLEKIVRMALHQSGLAFEILTSPVCDPQSDFPSRRVATSAFHAGLVSYYRDIALPLVEGTSTEFWRWRSLLTGWLLSTSGLVSHRLPELITRTNDDSLRGLVDDGSPTVPSATTARHYIDEMVASAHSLGSGPADYDWLDEFVFTRRMELA